MAEFDKPLFLVSPPMKGDRVKDAQFLLAHNRQGQNFRPGVADGTYGAQSAGATHRAKYWCGYPTADINNHFGQQLYSYLLGMEHKGWAPLPTAFKRRRTQRLKEQKPKAKVAALGLALADARSGIHESPAGSNLQMYGAWYYMNGVAWCMISASFWMVHAGVPGFVRGSHFSYVPNLVDTARMGQNHLALTRFPEPGDLVSYTINGVPNEHVEVFDKWEKQGESFWAVGGNTDNHRDNVNANGGAVVHQIRYTGMVTHFVRVGI